MTADDNIFGAAISTEPILAVKNVVETVQFWHDVLGFRDKWTWGDPAEHGGVSWNGASVQFSQNPALASASKGNAIFISVRNLESLYLFHRKKGAEIAEPLSNKPWGMAGYTVKELNGYYVVFAGALLTDKKGGSQDLPKNVKIKQGKLTAAEYNRLAASVKWTVSNDLAAVQRMLDATIITVIAEDSGSGDILGCAMLIGDQESFYYVKNVIVHPAWQSKHIGTAMMNEIDHWLEVNGADHSMVALITPESLNKFYSQFGFSPAFCMIKHIQRYSDDSSNEF